jgi:hypothetical protein
VWPPNSVPKPSEADTSSQLAGPFALNGCRGATKVQRKSRGVAPPGSSSFPHALIQSAPPHMQPAGAVARDKSDGTRGADKRSQPTKWATPPSTASSLSVSCDSTSTVLPTAHACAIARRRDAAGPAAADAKARRPSPPLLLDQVRAAKRFAAASGGARGRNAALARDAAPRLRRRRLMATEEAGAATQL